MSDPEIFVLDITGEVCPMTFVRTRLRLDRMGPGEALAVRLRGAEPARNVPRMAASLGHAVEITGEADGVTTLVIRKAGSVVHPGNSV